MFPAASNAAGKGGGPGAVRAKESNIGGDGAAPSSRIVVRRNDATVEQARLRPYNSVQIFPTASRTAVARDVAADAVLWLLVRARIALGAPDPRTFLDREKRLHIMRA
jgi:hypothetical protein